MTFERSSFRPGPAGTPGRRGGFTLLEIVVAVTILVTFLLPMMLIITKSKVRAIRYTQQREVRDFAQRKLFDRMHYYEEKDQGDFSVEGRPQWTWEIDPPEMVGSGEQVLLEYRIRVRMPQNMEENAAPTGEGSTYEMCIWSFPDERWYEEQDALYAQGQNSSLYGDPRN